MIRILDDYVVVAGPYDYMLAKDTGRLDKKTKTPELRPLSYHGSPRKVILALRDYMVRKSLANVDGDLSEAIRAIEAVDKRFIDVLNRAMGEER